MYALSVIGPPSSSPAQQIQSLSRKFARGQLNVQKALIPSLHRSLGARKFRVCCSAGSHSVGKQDERQSTARNGAFSPQIVTFSATLLLSAIISAVVACSVEAAVATEQKAVKSQKAAGKAAGDSAKKVKKPLRVMTVEERRKWGEELPIVEEKIPYTDILGLKKDGKLKAIVKHPNTNFKGDPSVCLVVLDDDLVLRTVIPPVHADRMFWRAWDSLGVGETVVDAYSPPSPAFDSEPWGQSGPSFTWLAEQVTALVAELKAVLSKPWTLGVHKGAKEERGGSTSSATVAGGSPAAVVQKTGKKLSAREREKVAAMDRAKKLKESRILLEKERKEKEAVLRRERELRLKAESKAREEREKREKEEAKRLAAMEKRELQSASKKESAARRRQKMIESEDAQLRWSRIYGEMAKNEAVRFFVGSIIFVLFYNLVVLNIKKRKKDFDDRIRLKQAEEEEKRKAMAEELVGGEAEDMDGQEKKKGAEEEDESSAMLAASRDFMKSGANVKAGRLSKSRRMHYLDTSDTVQFDDVAGLGDIRRELEEVVEFFVNAEKYRRRGSRIPTGVLLCGPPGVGKTLLAKAVAGEAGVNFFSISASQFVEVYVGVGAARVRALYNEARLNAPAVVFIDELDAVGRQRGLSQGSGGQERDATLNQLLMCLDGFDGNSEVITIAATNRVDILDTALIRPGRFDRKIYVPLPSFKGRIEILKVHARRKPMSDDVDYQLISTMTNGMNGAQLANILDSAALQTLRDGRREVETEDLIDAVRMEEGGESRERKRTPHLSRQVAFLEASLAVVAAAFPQYQDIQKMTIIPRKGEVMGGTRYSLDAAVHGMGGLRKAALVDFITVQMGPMVADEMIHGKDQMRSVWADAVNRARRTARLFVLQGMSDQSEFYGMFESYQPLSKVNRVDVEARAVLERCTAKAKEIVGRNRQLLEVIFETVLEKEELEGEEVKEMIAKYGDYDPFENPLSLEEIRERHLASFRKRLEGSTNGKVQMLEVVST